MKEKDIALIIIILFISAIISYFVSSMVITPDKNRKTEVEVVTPITTEFSKPDSRYFNSKSINPTQNIQIGNQDNQQPF